MRSGPAPRRRPALLPRLGLALFGIVLALAIGEVALRTVFRDELPGVALEGEQFERSGIPGVPWLYRRGRPGTTNALGLRDPVERTVEKPPGTYRVLVLGDSVTAIATDRDDDPRRGLWPWQLETRLTRRVGRRVEVLNDSTPGLSLRQELILLDARGRALDPDLVVFAYCENDIVETDVGQHENRDGFALLTLAEQRLYRQQQSTRARLSWYERGTPRWRALEASFARLGAVARETRVLLVALPVLSDDPAQQRHLPAVRELAAREGVPLYDASAHMAPPLSRYRRRGGHDDLHMNLAGHAALADALAAALEPVIAQGRWPP